MSRQYRIRVYGKQRKDIDPALLAQVVILFGRHLHYQRQQQAAEHAKTGEGSSESSNSSDSGVALPSLPPRDRDTPQPSEDDEDGKNVLGGGLT